MTKKLKTQKRRPRAGVTLIEMLVVVTIIGLFLALVGPKLWGNVDKARITAARNQIANFQSALGQYKLDTGTFPSTEQGLIALRTRPAEAPQWNGPYLPRDVPKDPWGVDYVYRFPGEHQPDEPEIICLGADRKPGGEGYDADIVSWK